MGELILVRHGQASFGAADYDQLSPTGQDQARSLGRWWRARGFCPQALFVGPRRRHAQTLDALLEGLLEAGPLPTPWPAALHEPGLDEYPAFEVMRLALPALRLQEPPIDALLHQWEAQGPEAPRSFQRLLEDVTRRWVRGELDIDGLRPWSSFREAVEAGLRRMTSQSPRGATVLAITSAGTISAALGHALDLRDEKVLEASWAMHNASSSSFLFSASGRFSLKDFNLTAHLTPQALTYR